MSLSSEPPIEIFTKETIFKNQSIVLTREMEICLKAVENYSTRENADRGNLFGSNEVHYQSIRSEKDAVTPLLKELVRYKLIAEIFEIVYTEVTGLQIKPLFICLTEKLRSVDIAIEKCIVRSRNAVVEYAREKKSYEPNFFGKIVSQSYWNTLALEDGDEIERLFQASNFLADPNPQMLNFFKLEMRNLLFRTDELLYHQKIGVFWIKEFQIPDAIQKLEFHLNVKLFPALALEDPVFRKNFKLIEEKEESSFQQNNSMDQFEVLQEKIELLMVAKVKAEMLPGFFIAEIIESKSKNLIAHQKKQITERNQATLNSYLNKLNNGTDFDSMFLRMNQDSTEEGIPEIIQALKKEISVLHAEWYTQTEFSAIFVMEDIIKLKSINEKIFKNYKDNSEEILKFRNLLERNEARIKPIFRDEEFVKLYGKNLQAVYFKYIPWFYKLGILFGIRFLTDLGYSKAKSSIQFIQMNRKFQLATKQEKWKKEKLKENLAKLDSLKQLKAAKALAESLYESIVFRNWIPNLKELCHDYSLLNPELIENLIHSYKIPVLSEDGKL